MSIRTEIQAQIVRVGFTMQELVDRLAEEYGWSDSVCPTCPLSCKGKVSDTRKLWSWPMCWDTTLFGRNGGITEESTVCHSSLCQVQGTGDRSH